MHMDESLQQQHKDFCEKLAQRKGVAPLYWLGYVPRLDGSHLQDAPSSASITTACSDAQVDESPPQPIIDEQHSSRADFKARNGKNSTKKRISYATVVEDRSQMDKALPTSIIETQHRSHANFKAQSSENSSAKHTSYTNIVKSTSQAKYTTHPRPNAEQSGLPVATCPRWAVGYCRFSDGQCLYAHHLFPRIFEDTRSEAHKFSSGLNDERWSWPKGNIMDWHDPSQSAQSGINARVLTGWQPWKAVLRYACKKCLYEFATVEEVVFHCKNECGPTRLRSAVEDVASAETVESAQPMPASPTDSFTTAAEEPMA